MLAASIVFNFARLYSFYINLLYSFGQFMAAPIGRH